MTGRDLMSVCCLVVALFVGALASPDRGRGEDPARPAAMQDKQWTCVGGAAALQIVCDSSSSSSSSSEGAFAGENAAACAGLQPLIATALLLQQYPWQLGGIVYHQTSSCHGTTYMCLLFACDVCSPALLP